MSKIDEIFGRLSFGYEFLMSDYAHSKEQEYEYEKQGLEEIAQAKQALYKDMVELIEDNEEDPFGDQYYIGRNQLRQELRTKLKEYYGVEE